MKQKIGPKKFQLTRIEIRLKRARMLSTFRAGLAAVQELGIPYFLINSTALGALREGEFDPLEDTICIGVYQWDLAALQRGCPEPTAESRNAKIKAAFKS